MSPITLDQIPHIASPAPSPAELIELGRTTPIVKSGRGVEMLSYDLAQKALNGEHFDKSASIRARLDEMGVEKGTQARADWELLLPATYGDMRTRFRILFAGMMRPGQVAKFKERVVNIVAGVIDEHEGRNAVEFMDEIAWRIPSRMYCDLVSAPYEMAPKFAELSNRTLGAVVAGDPALADDAVASIYETLDYVREHFEKRRENLGDDFTSTMIRYQMDGKVTEHELLINAVGILHASIDNTTHQMGIAIGTLLSRPEVWARLVENPDLIPGAVEEVIRFTPRVGSVNRIVDADIEFEGYELPEGTRVFNSIAAAHRDASILDDPDEFRIDRQGFRVLQFGGGNYNCLGQHLARLEIQEAIRALVTRYPNASLAGDFEIEELLHGREVRRLDVALA